MSLTHSLFPQPLSSSSPYPSHPCSSHRHVPHVLFPFSIFFTPLFLPPPCPSRSLAILHILHTLVPPSAMSSHALLPFSISFTPLFLPPPCPSRSISILHILHTLVLPHAHVPHLRILLAFGLPTAMSLALPSHSPYPSHPCFSHRHVPRTPFPFSISFTPLLLPPPCPSRSLPILRIINTLHRASVPALYTPPPPPPPAPRPTLPARR